MHTSTHHITVFISYLRPVGGFFTGLATGVASCVALPVTGVCVGAVQIGRGVFNSAEAVSSAGKGMVWNDDTREWFYYRLDDDAEEVKKTEEQRKKDGQDLSSGAGPNRKVKDDTYYKLLGVPTNANQSQIKKAYYKSARLCHPDKNRDPSARGKFQELGHAYQVLANDQSRAAYDRDGLNESNERISPQSIDPLLFFAILFGSDNVAPYIGELWLASKAETLLKDSKMAQDLMKDGTESEDIDKQSKRQEHVKQLLEEDEFAQRKRQVQCAINIRQRIQPFVESEEGMDESEFVVAVQAEAAKICQSSFGYIFCTAIGRTLELEATEFLGFSRSAFGSWDAHSANLSKNVRSSVVSFSNHRIIE
jgi:curved DNA-binding protein CbpA